MKKQRNTRQRQEVLKAVLESTEHPTADEIYLTLRENNPRISRGTVYRNLNVLSDNGEIQQIKAPNADRFDWKKEKHYHILCTLCDELTDASIPYQEDSDKVIAKETGYIIGQHQLIFEGTCPECQKQQPAKFAKPAKPVNR